MSLVTDQFTAAQPMLCAISHSHNHRRVNAERDAAHPLLHKVTRMLGNSPYSELRSANCEYHDGTVVLNGQVSSFYLKQLAQALVARVTPSSRIRNQLQVVYPECKHPRKPR
ncbi:MAG: BON domain-containing protein [Pirellulaceae bacterium]|jgi:osmotically-inducible protein OsmY|nr:BON domain-containing protein [Pirellulaceae bacterium]